MDRGRLLSILLPLAATIGAMASFQIGGAFAKHLFPAVGPQGAAALRLGLGALMLLAIARPWRAWPRPAPLGPLFALGVAMAGVILLLYLAIERLPLGVAMALQFLGPLAVAVVGSRRALDLVWTALAAAGVWLLVSPQVMAVDPIGVVFALGAAACWAGYILFGRAASAAFGRSTAALAVSIAAVLTLPVGVSYAGAALVAPAILPLALLVGLLTAAVPSTLEFYAMPRMPARTFAILMSLEPAFAALSGWLLLDEQLPAARVAGIAAVIVAAAGAAWSSAGAAPATATDAPPA